MRQGRNKETGKGEGRNPWWLLTRSEAAQLLEFALAVPFLVVFFVGIIDFGRGYHLKQKLTNAAREGVRISVEQPSIDLTSCSCITGASSPCTVEAVRDAVVNYLQGVNVDTSIIPPDPNACNAGTIQPFEYGTPPVLTIDRSFLVPDPGGGPSIVSSRVVLDYPFSWVFDQVIRLLLPSASYSSSFTISTEVIMPN